MDWANRYVCSPWHTIFCESTAHTPPVSKKTRQCASVITLPWEKRGEKKKQPSEIAKEKKKKHKQLNNKAKNPTAKWKIQQSIETVQEEMVELRTSFLKCQNWEENLFYLCSVLSLQYLNTKSKAIWKSLCCFTTQNTLIQMATLTPMWMINEWFSFARELTRLIFRSLNKCEGQHFYLHFFTIHLINVSHKQPKEFLVTEWPKSINCWGLYPDIPSLHKLL